MIVYVHDFVWFDAYLACGFTTPYDTPLFNVSEWEGVREFPRVQIKYNDMYNIMKILYWAAKRVGGWEREWLRKMVFFIVQYGSILISQQQHRQGGKFGYRVR